MSNIEHMVNRFLAWKLPADFSPDAGIGFKPYHPQQTPDNPMWPTGTNLLTAEQARAMFEYVLEGAKQPQAEAVTEMHDALCPALTGGDCTCTPPATIDKAWAQFCGGIGRGPDAPYPGMIEAFESHYGQTFTDKDWREETGVWAAAWKAAKAHGEVAPQQAEAVPSDVVRDADVEAAAKKMAEIFDYPWDFMPEKGRNTMRENVRAVLTAAQGEKP